VLQRLLLLQKLAKRILTDSLVNSRCPLRAVYGGGLGDDTSRATNSRQTSDLQCSRRPFRGLPNQSSLAVNQSRHQRAL